MRLQIAERMVTSLLHTAPHVTTVFEVDLGAEEDLGFSAFRRLANAESPVFSVVAIPTFRAL